MSFFETTYFHNTVQQWIWAAGVALAVMVGVWALRRIVIARLAAVTRGMETPWAPSVAAMLTATRTLLLWPLAFYAASMTLQLPPRIERVVSAVTVISLLLQAALWGNALIAETLRRYVKSKAAEDAAAATSVSVLGFMSRLMLWAVVALLALSNLGVDITALVAGLGIGGIAVALAAQNILGDLFASLSIVLDKPFVIGDFIIVGDLVGTVEHIGMKTTQVRALSGELIIFANADLLGSRIRNFKRMFERRVVFGLGVTYQTRAEQLARIPAILREVVEARPNVRFDRAHFKDYGDFSLNFEIVYYVLDPDYNKYMDTQQAINLEVYRRFAAEGIEFAYPTQTVYVQRAAAGA
jgi:small-conductance mechanosensitive channel